MSRDISHFEKKFKAGSKFRESIKELQSITQINGQNYDTKPHTWQF